MARYATARAITTVVAGGAGAVLVDVDAGALQDALRRLLARRR